MSKYSTKEDVYQSYFRNMCKTFYIAYKEVKRLEKEKKKLQEKSQSQEFEMVRELLKINVPEAVLKKYVDKRYTIENLKKEREKLKGIKEKSDKKKKEVETVLNFWINEYWDKIKNISDIIKEMEKENFLITVTCGDEVIGLMAYFMENSLKEHRIINLDEKCLEMFPTGEEIYKEFYEIYCIEDDEKMKEVIKKYF